MDGLFRGYRTPPKRSASGPSLSPFSTSPNQLQEVTASVNGTLFDQTKISPMRGRSVKEYDEQLTNLKKENFNLKLRIYFLEERMGSTFRPEDKDNIIRKNIEYQIDLETLRRELDEKQDLLCQAVKALELEDAEHKRIMVAKEDEIEELNDRLGSLEHKLESVLNTNAELEEKNERLIEDSTHMYNEAFGLQTDTDNAKEELTLLKEKILDLQEQLLEEKEHNSLLEHDTRDFECIQLRCANLEIELEDKNKKIETLSTELESNGHIISSCNLRIRTLEDILTAKSSDNKFKDKEIIHRDKILLDQTAEIEELRRLVEEGNVLCDKEQRQSENLKSAVMSRDNAIADLESKLEKCKSVIRNLEAKLDSIAYENKRQKDELLTIKQQRRFPDNKFKSQDLSPKKGSSPRSLSCSPSASCLLDPVDFINPNLKTLKLEEDNKKAYTLIQTLVAHSKHLEKLKAEHESALAERDQEIIQLKKEKYVLYNRLPAVSHTEDSENSTEEIDENKNSDESKIDMTTLEWAKQVEDLLDVIKEKEVELEQYKMKCDQTTTTLEERDNRITELEKEILNLKEELYAANKKIDELKTEKSEFNEKPLSWIRVTEEKDKKIEQLESEVRKHTFNLQGIVNNELWDKNREIEKLQNRFTEKLKVKEQEISEMEKQLTSKDVQLKILKDKISELGIQINLPSSLFTSKYNLTEAAIESSEEVSILKEQLRISHEECKYLHQTVEELRLQLRNTPERDSDNKIIQLKEDFAQVQEDYEKSEKLRQETVNLCSLLTTRLEELAHFLDSLLKHKSVLGMLGSKARSAIKQAIDQSLDLSKSLTVSMMNADQSLAQLSSLTGILNTTATSVNTSLFEHEDVYDDRFSTTSLTYNSHLSRQKGDGLHNNIVKEQAEIISILRAQIETMKKEIELRDTELCKQTADHVMSSDAHESSLKNDHEFIDVIMDLQNKSTPVMKSGVLSPDKIYHNLITNKSCPTLRSLSLDNHSESEAWSEPDRGVSQARIGLDKEALKNTSSANNLNRSRSNKTASIEGATSESTEDDTPVLNKTPSKRGSGSVETRNTVSLLQENVAIMENKLKEKENEILSLKTAIMQLENKSLELKLSMSEEIAKLRNEKIDVDKLLKDTEEKIKIVDLNNDQILSKLQFIEQQRDNALQELEKAFNQIEVLQMKTTELEHIIHENEKEYQNKLNETDENWKNHIQNIEKEMELKVKDIQEASNILKNQYEADWIHKNILNKELAKTVTLTEEVETLKDLVKSLESKAILMQKSEVELKNKLVETEEFYNKKLVLLKRELNESTLCASQAALERTKVNNEKLKLEAEIRKLESRESMRINDFEEKEKDFINMKNSLQKQISVIEQEKSYLQLKVSEFETANAELHNRLIKFQTSENQWAQPTNNLLKSSMPVTNFKIYGKHSLGPQFIRQKSEISGYTSEDVLTDENDAGLCNRTVPDTFQWFTQSNVNIVPADVPDVRNITNSSPDLGIESDQGRFSSLETNTTNTRPLLQTLELTASMNNLLSNEQLDNREQYCNIKAHQVLEKENTDLKINISKLEVGLEKTMSELSKINKTKKQVEKGICKQIHKTSLVLRQARANLDSGSENENKRK